MVLPSDATVRTRSLGQLDPAEINLSRTSPEKASFPLPSLRPLEESRAYRSNGAEIRRGNRDYPEIRPRCRNLTSPDTLSEVVGSWFVDYPESNGTSRVLAEPTSSVLSLRLDFSPARRVPRIPRVKLRRRAARKFLVPNSLVKVSFDLGIPPPGNARSSLRGRESPIRTYAHVLLGACYSGVCAQSIPLVHNPFASSGGLITSKTIERVTEPRRESSDVARATWLNSE